MKSKFKILITTFSLLLVLLSSTCIATDTINNKEITTNSDLCIKDSEYVISNTINGNVFATVDVLDINSSGAINGNLFVTADNVNIKSDTTYSDNQKDELGNPVITINKASSVSR